MQSTVWLLLWASVWNDTTLVITLGRNYTASQYQALFTDLQSPQGYDMYQGVQSINSGFPPPNVPTHCFYGVGSDTQ